MPDGKNMVISCFYEGRLRNRLDHTCGGLYCCSFVFSGQEVYLDSEAQKDGTVLGNTGSADRVIGFGICFG